jgi:chemotaxis protein MotB
VIPRRHDHVEVNESWLMSYADMITLLLCFFVIFVSVSEPKKEKISKIADGMAGKFGAIELSTPFQGAYQAIDGIVENNRLFKETSITKNSRGIELELANGSFFLPDSVDFQPDKLPVLEQMVKAFVALNYMDSRIIIEVHTSDVPPVGAYNSNWDLSAARAAHLVRFFIEQGIPSFKLKAVGMADSDPKVPNLDAKGEPISQNREKNQRVVIKLERKG